jgi:glycosyltransferase involved in cell wall biosynthesis
MSKFILIDHSLKGVGGHHYEYAAHVLSAAERAKYAPVLATHRRFRPGADYPQHWPTWPLFRFGTYSKYTMYRSQPHRDGAAHAGGMARWSLAGLWERVADFWHRRGREKRVAALAAGLERLFAEESLAAGDQVFLPTLSELDLEGVVRFLEATPNSRVADWHLQFHYNIFDGREPEFAAQAEKLDVMREAFAAALARTPEHRLHFYNTTEQLAAQYARMGLARFYALPYPVNHALAVPAADCCSSAEPTNSETVALETPRPLRIACLGAIRPEKGAKELAGVVEALWDSHFLPGRCQLVVQSNKRRFRLPLPIEDADTLPDGVEPVVYAPHPLPMDAYVELIRAADIGLLLYDSRRYYARCSGVLVELLSVGTPVIASAGCWMAEQLAEANFAHLDRAANELRNVGALAANKLTFKLDEPGRSTRGGLSRSRNVPLVDGCLRLPAGGEGVFAEVDVPRAATHAMCSFRWHYPAEAGTYCRVTLESLGADEDLPAERSFVVGRRDGDQPVRVMFPIAPSVFRVRLRWENEYDNGPIALEDLQIDMLSAEQLPGATYPLGAVGLIAADDSQVAALVDDLVSHWPHYRQTALAFAEEWSAFHNADRIVAELAARAKPARGVGHPRRAA